MTDVDRSRSATLTTGATGATGAPSEALVVPLRRTWLLAPLLAGLALCVVSAVWRLARGRGWEPASLQLDRVLNVDEDLSVLNWLTASGFLLAGCAALLATRTAGRAWVAVAGLAAFVSVDEAVGLHDPVQVAVERWLVGGGTAMVAVALVALAGAVVVLRFLAGQDRSVGARLLGVLLLIAVAAVGVDALGPDLVDDPARRLEPWYVAKATCEEALELVAAVLALDACLLAAAGRGRASAPRRRRGGPFS